MNMMRPFSIFGLRWVFQPRLRGGGRPSDKTHLEDDQKGDNVGDWTLVEHHRSKSRSSERRHRCGWEVRPYKGPLPHPRQKPAAVLGDFLPSSFKSSGSLVHATVSAILPESDFVSVHVAFLPSSVLNRDFVAPKLGPTGRWNFGRSNLINRCIDKNRFSLLPGQTSRSILPQPTYVEMATREAPTMWHTTARRDAMPRGCRTMAAGGTCLPFNAITINALLFDRIKISTGRRTFRAT
ncbi:hypothetical protein E2562_025293 [Oryza meyeriana var. granulata]|uniref:Uncharacterized protein n=1 Tax=Oryza meyeriana var. granulata TaxID=110450 RepID=A0A6G1EP83_9ORYZ|nr:hypothetical protein E2562_025293 [Oryza meyeriana var. granulata]